MIELPMVGLKQDVSGVDQHQHASSVMGKQNNKHGCLYPQNYSICVYRPPCQPISLKPP